jgi:hypothetical protein
MKPKARVPLPFSQIRWRAFLSADNDCSKPFLSRREVAIITHMETTLLIVIPPEPPQKVIDGLIKNAVENTPDEGKTNSGC